MNRFWAAATLTLALVSPTAAQDATLVKIQGPVFVRLAGASTDTPAKGGEELLYGDGVKTGPGAIAHLVLGGRGAVLLRENTTLTLVGDPERTRLRIPAGEFLVGLRQKLVGGQAFRVVTPSATAAVRGTLFWGKSDANKIATFASFGHAVAVTGTHGTVLILGGETTTVALGAAPAAPMRHQIPVSYLDNFRVDGSLETLESLIDLPKPVPAPAAPAPK